MWPSESLRPGQGQEPGETRGEQRTREQRNEMASAARDAEGTTQEQGEATGAALRKNLDTKVSSAACPSFLQHAFDLHTSPGRCPDLKGAGLGFAAPTGWMSATARFPAYLMAQTSLPTLRQCLQGWKLVLTGHSLGAGAAALISLKIHDRYPGGPHFPLTADILSLTPTV